GLVLPAFASINPVTGSVRLSINGYNISKPNALNFQGRLSLTLSGNVNDFTTWKVGLRVGDADIEDWGGRPVAYDYGFVTVAPPKLPIKLEIGKLSIASYGPLTIYGDAFNIGGASGVNIISDKFYPGLTNWLMLIPDVEKNLDDNYEAIVAGANFAQNWGRVTGVFWTRRDKEGLGYRVSGLFNVVPNTLTLYASLGQRPGDTVSKYQVVGVNLPMVATETGWNPYIEYDVYNKVPGFYVTKTITPNTSFFFYLTQDASTKAWKITPYLQFSF
ncbi:MAG TPA: hypothetical protein PK811_00450, partial [bacterium]|nr:hypothetical protein [bacterium]